ncbi:MAG: B12-binding domain-containing radical SAM protein [bacterium]
MDVLLINPRNPFVEEHQPMPPLGLSSIGCFLQKNEVSTEILDLEVRQKNFNLFDYIKKIMPKVVGISGTTISRFESFKIAKIVKKVSSSIITVYGGCHASFTAEDTLQNISDIDYIVHGEGELTFLELVSSLIKKQNNFEKIQGISFRGSDGIIKTGTHERISDLDIIPYSRHLLEMDKYKTKLDFLNLDAAAMMTSRGCVYNCYFCSAKAIFGNIYTRRSAKNVVEEIEYCMKEFNIKGIKFFDSTFTINKQHVLSITREMKNRNIILPWECEIRADTVDKALLENMKSAGCYYVDIGLESASLKVLETICKGITPEDVLKVLQWCKELEIKTKVFFTLGHVGESNDDMEKTIQFIEKNHELISRFAIGPYIKIFPGTKIENYAKKMGILPPNFSWSEPLMKGVLIDKKYSPIVPILPPSIAWVWDQ